MRKKTMQPKGGKRVFVAIAVAAKAHGGQYRKGTQVPYINHPLSVAKILIESGADEAMVIAGILHDTLEDTQLTQAEIKRMFGKKIIKYVESVSEPAHDNKPWEERKSHTVKMLKTAPRYALNIAFADKLDNLRSLSVDYQKYGSKLWARFNRPKNKQRWYYQSLAEVFWKRKAQLLSPKLVDEFRKLFSDVFDLQ